MKTDRAFNVLGSRHPGDPLASDLPDGRQVRADPRASGRIDAVTADARHKTRHGDLAGEELPAQIWIVRGRYWRGRGGWRGIEQGSRGRTGATTGQYAGNKQDRRQQTAGAPQTQATHLRSSQRRLALASLP